MKETRKTTPLGENQAGLRAHNERLILTLLRRMGAMPKVKLAALTGLSAQTVSVIMRSLEADGLIEKRSPQRGKVGQPSVPMRLASNGAFFFGLKIGRRSSELILIDFNGEICARDVVYHKFPCPKEALSFAQNAYSKQRAQLSKQNQQRIVGMGIALPFYLWDWAETLGLPPGSMDAWRETDLRESLQAELGIPVYQQNDASCASSAELLFGASEMPSDFLQIYLSNFIGGGIVENGRLFCGGSGNAAAFASIPVVVNGKAVQLAETASLCVLEKELSRKGYDATFLWRETQEWQIASDIIQTWTENAAHSIAMALVAAVAVSDITHVLIDGAIPAIWRNLLVKKVTQALSHQNLHGIRMPHIHPGSLGAEARALGAASLPLCANFMIDHSGIATARRANGRNEEQEY